MRIFLDTANIEQIRQAANASHDGMEVIKYIANVFKHYQYSLSDIGTTRFLTDWQSSSQALK